MFFKGIQSYAVGALPTLPFPNPQESPHAGTHRSFFFHAATFWFKAANFRPPALPCWPGSAPPVSAVHPLAADASKDADILNVALGLEHQGIGAYQIGADSGLLKQPAINISLLFQSHHKAHRDALIAAIQKLGGTPVPALSTAEYAEKPQRASSLKTQEDVLKVALGLERGATNAYLGVMPSFQDRELAKVCGRLAADGAMHWTALQSTLGLPLPANALTFGA